ncbi:MAG: HEAT repeat domain-containing protein [Deltaproteobacteria bacterium]|nr:HEAT repeat domain-containing protein [Deltaproteobacteria bacterium]
MKKLRTLTVSLLAVVLSAPLATAQQRAPSDTAQAIGADTDTLIAAIQAAAVSGAPEGAESISRLLSNGVPPRAAAAGLDALGVLGLPQGSPAVLRFLEHRRASLRRHAVAAAQSIHSPDLVRALAGKLSDTDEHVRLDAATALATVATSAEIPACMLAFEHDVNGPHGASGSPFAHELAKAIGRVGSPAQVQALLAYLRRAPFATMSDALSMAVRRRDLPEELKLRIVTAVGDLATPSVRPFLQAIASSPRECGAAVSRAASSAADRIAG